MLSLHKQLLNMGLHQRSHNSPMSVLSHLRRLLYISSLLLSSQLLGVAQEQRVDMPFLTMNTLDTAILRIDYRYQFKDGSRSVSNQMTLLVGECVQSFQGTANFYTDSLGVALENKRYPSQFLYEKFNRLPKGMSNINWQVYTNYPQGKVSITDRVLMDHYLSVEPLEKPQWTIKQDSVRNIMGYQCKLGVSNLYGRLWYAWYTEDIAYSTGPWILRGLPGLIVQAYDSEHLHDFLLLSIAEWKHPIAFRESTYFKYPRERVIREYMKYASDPGRAFQSTGLATPLGGKKDTPPIKRTIPYVPLRRVTP